MSDLSNMGMDPNTEETTGAFNVVPAGRYEMVIIADNLKDAKSGKGKVLSLTFQIVSGPEKDSTIIVRLNIKNTSEVAERIGQGTLKRLCRLTGVTFPPANTDHMKGKPIMGTVVVKSFKSNNTGDMLESNDIKAFNSRAIEMPGPEPSSPTQDNSDIPW